MAKSKSMADYAISRYLGRGAYGELAVADRKADKAQVLIRTMFFKDQRSMDRAVEQVKTLVTLRHAHIVQCFDWFSEDDSASQRLTVYSVLEYCQGRDLKSRIREARKSNEFYAELKLKEWFIYLASAVEYLHSRKLAHKNIKPSNVLFGGELMETLKLSEIVIVGDDEESESDYTGVTGIRVGFNRLPPEMLNSNSDNVLAADIWSLGLVYYEIATLHEAYQAKDFYHYIRLVNDGPPSRSDFPSHYSSELHQFVCKMLVGVDERVNASDVLCDHYLLDAVLGTFEKAHSASGNAGDGNSGKQLQEVIEKLKQDLQSAQREVIQTREKLGNEERKRQTLEEDIKKLTEKEYFLAKAMHQRSDYVVLRHLGNGAFGQVRLVQRKSDRAKFVVKEVNLSKLSNADDPDSGKKMVDMASREANRMASLQHPNVVRIFGSFEETFEGCLFYHMIMEFCESGDLKGLAAKHKAEKRHFSPAIIQFWTVQLASVVKYLHDRTIYHRDIKPANIFVLYQGRMLKLGDFGIAKDSETVGSTAAGTLPYMAPELFQNEKYTHKCDVWSLGVVLYELAAQKRPFEASEAGLAMIILETTPKPLPPRYSGNLQNLVKKLLRKEHRRRYNMAAFMADPFMPVDNNIAFPGLEDDDLSAVVAF